jgi:diguanylate cyclase (GGDEF)-like protein
LTSLFNSLHFEQTVTRERRAGFAAQAPLALRVIDVDHFKRCNDAYGRPAGDVRLRAVAGALCSGASATCSQGSAARSS